MFIIIMSRHAKSDHNTKTTTCRTDTIFLRTEGFLLTLNDSISALVVKMVDIRCDITLIRPFYNNIMLL